MAHGRAVRPGPFSFWLSHVPPERLADFLGRVRGLVRPGGQVFILDSLPAPSSRAVDHDPASNDGVYETRKLNDGSQFRIIKCFYGAAELVGLLSQHGFEANAFETGSYFVYAVAKPS